MMLKLLDVEGKAKCTISIEGYVHSAIEKDEGGNWLKIVIELQRGEKIFRADYPAMTTNELENMYRWFERISKKEIPRHTTLFFVAPCLQFELCGLKDETVFWKIDLYLVFSPDFPLDTYSEISGNSHRSLFFASSLGECKAICESIKTQLKKYPHRTEKSFA